MFALSGRRRRLVLFLALFALALLPRLAALERYVTPDELNWVYRSIGLRRALLASEWAATLQSGHPGVITTWLGAAAIQLQLWLEPAAAAHLSWLNSLYWLPGDSAEAYRHLSVFLGGGRLAVALATSLGVGATYLTATSLVGERAALLGGLLLALDPFAAGLSGLLHVDALLATFMVLALLLALHVRAGREGRRLFAAGAGLFTALALLNKTPAVVLLPLVPLMLLLPPAGAGEQQEETGQASRWTMVILWLGTAAATVLLLLPAAWSAPQAVVETMSGLTGRLVEEAVRPTFFLGEMGLDHGPLFYPVALFFRLSPATTLGLLSLPVLGLRVWRSDRRAGVRTIAWFLLFALLFLLLITLVAKKHDRYALPAQMALTLVAGWGSAWAVDGSRPVVRRLAFLGLALLQMGFLLDTLPYPLTAYNWLAGGEQAAYRLLPSGWGEGASAGARRLDSSGEADVPTLFSNNLVSTAPFYPGEIYHRQPAYLSLLKPDDFLLVTRGEQQVQTPAAEGSVAAALQAREPVDRVAFSGREQAWLYSGLSASDLGLPRLEMSARDYRFDRGPQLVGGGAAFLPWPAETLVALQWQAPAGRSEAGYQLQLQLVDDAGQVRVDQEGPLLNQAGQPASAWPADMPQTVYYTQPLPPDLPPGDYRFVVRVFDDAGAQLGVFDQLGRFAGTGAPLAQISVTPPASQPALAIPAQQPGNTPLAGYGVLPATVETGAALTLDLWWRVEEPATYLLGLSLGDEADGEAIEPWPLDTSEWKMGQRYHIRPRWRLPPELAAGRYPLDLLVLNDRGERATDPIRLGTVEVQAVNRDFELPPGLTPPGVQAGSLATLADVSLTRSGATLEMRTVWQARGTTETAYTAFVHLLDEGGHVVAQVDRPPAPPTTGWVAQEVVTENYTLPLPAGEGRYRVATGLYDPDSGQRLPLYAGDGTPLPEAQYTVEVEVPER